MKKLLLLCIPLCLFLQGCIPVVVGAAAGSLFYYNRHTLKQIVDDGAIQRKAYDIIRKHRSLTRNTHIVIAPFYGNVLLAGQVGTPSQRTQIQRIVKRIHGVRRIYNHITLSGPTSPMTRSSDSWITTKVKTDMVATEGLRSGQIKVVTENGNVYLMGKVSPKQAKLATHVARRISGVQHVITLFE